MRYATVAIDYFTKWVEVEPLATITEAKTSRFIWKYIICRFSILRVIVTNNGKQFDNEKYKKMCHELGIRTYFSSPVYPQANGQVEAINRNIKNNLKTKLSHLKKAWVEEFPKVLWAYRTALRNSTDETPYSISFGAETMVRVEIGAPNYCTQHFLPDSNETDLQAELDLLEE